MVTFEVALEPRCDVWSRDFDWIHRVAKAISMNAALPAPAKVRL